TATGTTPLGYQWRRNGTNITGATSYVYSITNVQTLHRGDYSVRVSNSVGTVFSDDARLTVKTDPFNMGKGDWIYFLSMATNKLGGNVPSVTNLTSLMNYERLQGMQFLVVKAGDGATIWDQFNAELVTAAHNAGLKIFGYGRVYGLDIPGEIAVATNVLSLGADGFIIDAEIEYESHILTNNHAAAEEYCQGIRAAYPNAFLGHAPFALINSHPTFPYVTFGKYVDVVMPQCYWKSFGISPSNMVHQLDTQWRNWQNSLTGSDTNAIKPLVPIGQAWSPSSTNVTTGAEIAEFVNRLKTNSNPASMGGYKGVSFWRADLHSPDMWGGISGVTIGNPTGAPMILSQPENQTVHPGDTATFTVEATGSGALGYQWRRNGIVISGATNSIYARTNVQTIHAGVYSVIVSNAAGTVLSSDAVLSLSSHRLWFETFESGLGYWTTISSPLTNSTAQNHTSGGTNAALVGSSANRMYRNLDSSVEGHSKVTFWIYDSTQTRAYGEVRAYSGGGYGAGSLQQILAVGRYHTAFSPAGTGNLANETLDTTKYQGRVFAGESTGWFNLNNSGVPARSTGWHKFEIERLPDERTINFYVDGVLGRSITNTTAFKWNTVTIGSVAAGSTAGNAWFDDIAVECFGIPVITTQPVSQTVNSGGSAAFIVAATNNVTSYQWRKNGQNIVGATGTTLFLPYVTGADAGEYTVVVGNGVGSVISQTAVLAIIAPPSILIQPGNQTVSAGVDVTMRVVLGGTPPFSYQWRKNGVNLSDGGNISGANTSELLLNNVSHLDAASYSVVISNPAGTVTSANAVLTLNGTSIFFEDFESGTLNNWTTVSAGLPFNILANMMNPVAGTKTATITNSLQKMYHNLGVEVGGRARATFWIYDDGGSLSRSFGEIRASSGSGFNQGSLQQVLAIGNYKTPFDSNTGSLANESMDASRYQGRVYAGTNAGWFNLNAVGAPSRSLGWHKFDIVRAADGATVHFYVDGVLSRTIPKAVAATWDSVAVGSYGSGSGQDYGVAWFDDIRIENLDNVILAQPNDQTINQGGTATFTVSATGSSHTYQWYKNGVSLPGATLSTLVLSNVQSSNQGDYSVVVTTGADTEPSTLARLTVITPPVITGQPASQTLSQNSTATFTVIAQGINLTYQWKKNGQSLFNGANVAGATSANLAIQNVGVGDEGTYTVEISNSAGLVTSLPASLYVVIPPSILNQPVSQVVHLGDPVAMSVVAEGTSLIYQWKRYGVNLVNGGNISGANSSVLTLSSAAESDIGFYAVTISNSAGAITSSQAGLAVLLPQTIDFSAIPDKLVGDPSFTLEAVVSSGLPASFEVVSGNAVTISGNVVTILRPGTVTIRAFNDGDIHFVEAHADRTFTVRTDALELINVDFGFGEESAKSGFAAAGFSAGDYWNIIGPEEDHSGTFYLDVLRANGSASGVEVHAQNIWTYATVGSPDPMFNRFRMPEQDGANITVAISSLLDGTYDFYLYGHGWQDSHFTKFELTIGNTTTPEKVTSGQPGWNNTNWTEGVQYVRFAQVHVQQGQTVVIKAKPAASGSGVAYLNGLQIARICQTVEIEEQPEDQVATEGETATFSVGALGSDLAFQWVFNGNPIADATTSTFSIPNVGLEHAGAYKVMVGNRCETLQSHDVSLTVITPPVITMHPQSKSVETGTTTTFTVEASGTDITYQWKKDGNNLVESGNHSGVQTSTLTILNATSAQAGNYSVVVANSLAQVTSSIAVLSVVAGSTTPPEIVTQPLSQMIDAGESVTFSVIASGTEPLSYQWRKNGQVIADATTSSHTIAQVETGDAGSYTVVISNAAGQTTSAVAVLTVNGQVSTPVFSRDGGHYAALGSVVVTCATVGATIHYTVDGSEPGTSDPIVESGSAIEIRWSQTLKARAWKGAMLPSEVKSAT
ncbi:MAG: immunoglobulin domain-containing protein, partial [Limisphaerales bacterium]